MTEAERVTAEKMTAELSTFKQQRGTVKRNITNLNAKIEREGSDIDETIMQCRLAILESYFKEVTFIQQQIERLDPADTGRSDLEENYISGKSKLMRFLNDKHPASSMHNNSTFLLPPAQTNSRLPNLRLPQFFGKYSDYKKFMSSFKHMIHNDETISKIDKFNYLSLCLSGPALAVVQAYQITEMNYEKPLKGLQERYDNNVLIFLEHAIFEIPPMIKDDSASLRHIIDTMSALRGSLLSLGEAADVMNAILIHIDLTKLDVQSKITYNEKIELKVLPKWEDACKLLSRRCQFLESRLSKETSSVKQSVVKFKDYPKKLSKVLLTAISKCEICQGDEHYLGNCPEYNTWPICRRSDYIKKTGRCLNCFRKGHVVAKCQSKTRCRVCKQPHHTTLHEFTNMGSSNTTTQPNNCASTVAVLARSKNVSVLPTELILIKDNCGIYQPIRTLLDSCSEVNFMTTEAAQRLRLKCNRTIKSISGIGDIITEAKYCTATTIKSRVSSFERYATFFISKNISAMHPAQNIDISTWKVPPNIELADPLFHESKHIELLLSTNFFFDLLEGGKISLGQGLPFIINTSFGWLIGGGIDANINSRAAACKIATLEKTLDEILPRFWEIEEYVPPRSYLSDEEAACEQHFAENVSLCDDGRVQVRLLFKESPTSLGNSYNNARKRFLALERRLEKDEPLKKLYCEFMTEYEELGHMTKVKQFDADVTHYFIPHHSVMRPESETDNFETNELIKNEVTAILAKCQLQLAKWNCNNPNLFDACSEEYLIKTNEQYSTKALGLMWQPMNDVFSFSFKPQGVKRDTKRTTLSTIAKIHDLLGILRPIIVRCKILMQDLWIKGLDWDEELTGCLAVAWAKLKEDLRLLHTIKFPRYVLTSTKNE